MECEYCHLSLKSKYTLKSHLTNNKSCLKKRDLVIETKFICIVCKSTFINNKSLNNHVKNCKVYKQHFIHQNELKEKENEYQHILKEKENEYQYTLKEKEKEYQYTLKEKEKEYQHTLKEKDNKYQDLYLEYTKLQVRYEDLIKEYNHTITKLENKINQCDQFIQKLAQDGCNKPSVSTVNHLSPTYTLDNLKTNEVENTLREYYTENDFYGGQKRLANFIYEKVIKTPDDKFLICCTDTSRKKFKIIDSRGNLKEDIDARILCDKLKVPTHLIIKEIYAKVLERIDIEKARLTENDSSRKSKLIDESL